MITMSVTKESITTIEGNVSRSVKERVAQIAKYEGRSVEDVAGSLLSASFEVDDADEELTRKAIDEADAGGPFATNEEVRKYLESWGKDDELPVPKATIRL